MLIKRERLPREFMLVLKLAEDFTGIEGVLMSSPDVRDTAMRRGAF